MFTSRVAVMWTVNDFPAYAMVSGWSTKGYMACPACKEDVTSEHRLRPREWSGDEIVEQLNRLDFSLFGKTKNVFDTLVGTILDIEGKTKDTIKARLDLERMGIRMGLWMNRDSDKARRDLAFFSIKPNDKKEFLKFVSFVKFPDGYASNIAHCLHHDIVQVLCKFEMIFPPAFFTSMMHVMVHLPEEALLAGPVNYRWMYPIERLLGELKKSMSDMIRRRRAVTTKQSSEAPTQPTSAATGPASAVTVPALMDHWQLVLQGPRPLLHQLHQWQKESRAVLSVKMVSQH
ncbi:hypothetical protein L3X38_011207 [Prunus dulcis]|uniref:DUF4218 domain-containing protein n=1 Tax=Prunus dulcis TaxID=3755 RepID=A0AAD4WHP2_PRUDU|nr:hypothetical protein L3X38_011207 [Prunus dulcis]